MAATGDADRGRTHGALLRQRPGMTRAFRGSASTSEPDSGVTEQQLRDARVQPRQQLEFVERN